jgi:hypothetical protein
VIAKLAIAGIVVLAAAFGAGWHAIGAGTPSADNAKPDHFGGLDYVRIQPFGVPVIEDGVLEGYVISEWVFTIDAKVKAAMSVPPELLLKEDAFRAVYGETLVDFDDLDRVDLAALGETMRARINARLGREVIGEVLVQKFDYVERDAIRDNDVRAVAP